jgi:biopolymer transport protein ExbB
MYVPQLKSRVFSVCLRLVVLAAVSLASVQAQTNPPAAVAQTAAASVAVNATAAANANANPNAIMAPVAAPPNVNPPGTSNPYGLRSVWREGDLVARLTLLALAVMSLYSWYIIVAKLLEQRLMNRQVFAARNAFTNPASLRHAAETLPADSVFRFIVDSSLDALKKHDSLARQVDLSTWLAQDIAQTVGSVQMRTQTGLAVLGTVGSTAPFVGLFGTVWGIYNALVTIGVSGQASIDKVAGPVGEALIMTALGLAVAVPAVLGYNWLVRRNRLAMHNIKGFSSNLHTLLLVKVDAAHRAVAKPVNDKPAVEKPAQEN